MYSEVTNSLKITVIPAYQDDLSSPGDACFVWSYNIFVENYGNNTVQLMNRCWRIIDADGVVQELKGAGVAGQQPVLRPGEAFEYTSHAQLKTSSGIMLGRYEMIVTDNGNKFDAIIPTFSLDNPYVAALLN